MREDKRVAEDKKYQTEWLILRGYGYHLRLSKFPSHTPQNPILRISLSTNKKSFNSKSST